MISVQIIAIVFAHLILLCLCFVVIYGCHKKRNAEEVKTPPPRIRRNAEREFAVEPDEFVPAPELTQAQLREKFMDNKDDILARARQPVKWHGMRQMPSIGVASPYAPQ